jgi:hypothetical protein
VAVLLPAAVLALLCLPREPVCSVRESCPRI